MEFLSFVFFTFMGVCTVVACTRSGKLVIHLINNLFDKLENRFM